MAVGILAESLDGGRLVDNDRPIPGIGVAIDGGIHSVGGERDRLCVLTQAYHHLGAGLHLAWFGREGGHAHVDDDRTALHGVGAGDGLAALIGLEVFEIGLDDKCSFCIDSEGLRRHDTANHIQVSAVLRVAAIGGVNKLVGGIVVGDGALAAIQH